jgi:hypothetical protein
MQNVNYSLGDRRKRKKDMEASCQQLHRTLDSLGNNLMAILWLAELALATLLAGDNPEQAKQNLQKALQAGDKAKKLMRLVLNSQKIDYFDTQALQARLM